MTMKRKKALKVIGVSALITLAAVFLFYFELATNFFWYLVHPPKKFDPIEWKKGDPVERGRMLDNLLSTINLVGREKSQVLRLLGRPDREVGHENGKTTLYYLISNKRFAFDPWIENLVLEFDRQGRCIRVVICD